MDALKMQYRNILITLFLSWKLLQYKYTRNMFDVFVEAYVNRKYFEEFFPSITSQIIVFWREMPKNDVFIKLKLSFN